MATIIYNVSDQDKNDSSNVLTYRTLEYLKQPQMYVFDRSLSLLMVRKVEILVKILRFCSLVRAALTTAVKFRSFIM